VELISREDFKCSCGCGFDTIDFELRDIYYSILYELGTSPFIHSACRCKEHNADVGGAEKSQHLLGRAMDIDIEDISPKELYAFLNKKYPDKYGIGLYNWGVHIDTRDYKARWDYSGEV